MKMVRKQVYITTQQDEALKRLARESGSTEAELFRRGIDMVTCEDDAESVRRREAAERLLANLKERAKTVPGSTDKWRREDAYDDERHARLLR